MNGYNQWWHYGCLHLNHSCMRTLWGTLWMSAFKSPIHEDIMNGYNPWGHYGCLHPEDIMDAYIQINHPWVHGCLCLNHPSIMRILWWHYGCVHHIFINILWISLSALSIHLSHSLIHGCIMYVCIISLTPKYIVDIQEYIIDVSIFK